MNRIATATAVSSCPHIVSACRENSYPCETCFQAVWEIQEGHSVSCFLSVDFDIELALQLIDQNLICRDVNLLIVGIDNAGKSTTVASMQRGTVE